MDSNVRCHVLSALLEVYRATSSEAEANRWLTRLRVKQERSRHQVGVLFQWERCERWPSNNVLASPAHDAAMHCQYKHISGHNYSSA